MEEHQESSPSEPELFVLGRQMSTATILFHWAIADRLGVNVTDWKCADLIYQAGSLTAGQLAEMTGLSTGAITGVIDRLEAARFAERKPDPHDRRKVIVTLTHERDDEAYEIFGPLLKAQLELMAKYNERDLAMITDYLKQTIQILRNEADRLRGRT